MACQWTRRSKWAATQEERTGSKGREEAGRSNVGVGHRDVRAASDSVDKGGRGSSLGRGPGEMNIYDLVHPVNF